MKQRRKPVGGILLSVIFFPLVLVLFLLFCIGNGIERIRLFLSRSQMKYTVGILSTGSYRVERAIRRAKWRYRYVPAPTPDGLDGFLLEDRIFLLCGKRLCFNDLGQLSVQRWECDPTPVENLVERDFPEMRGAEFYLCYDRAEKHTRKNVLNALDAHPRAVALTELPDWLETLRGGAVQIN